MERLKKTRLGLLGLLSTILFTATNTFLFAAGEQPSYFPPKSQDLLLAITAQGNLVKMTYTPATYRIRREKDDPALPELRIRDALLKEQSGSEDTNPGKRQAKMKLVFQGVNEDGSWQVTCGSQIIKPDAPSLLIEDGSCHFPTSPSEWSSPIIINPGNKTEILMKTVWDNATTEDNYGSSQYEDLINAFAFQALHGRVEVAETKETDIRPSPELTAYQYRTVEKKHSYESALNWAVFLSTDPGPEFKFALDVHDTDELILFDKDADAAKLYGPTIPNDPGIAMHVTWNDHGRTPLSANPEWTLFDQTNRTGFHADNFNPGETNSYQGPSGDTTHDVEGIRSIQWYKISVKEHKTNFVHVTWGGFQARDNGFAFAATKAIQAEQSEPQCSDGLDNDGDGKIDDKDPGCRDEKNNYLPQKDDERDSVIPKPVPIKPKKVGIGFIEASINSAPLPHPDPESYGLDPNDALKNTITYTITVKNVADGVKDKVDLLNVNVGFEPPKHTSFEDGRKEPRKFDLTESLAPGEMKEVTVKVVLDATTKKDFDISSKGRVKAGASNNPSVTLPELIHHVGKGEVNISVDRCYAFDYFGGKFKCAESCKALEPGTKITIEDTLKNSGGISAQNYQYFPHALPEAFVYLPHSIRLDDPENGLPVSTDGEHFPLAEGIPIEGPISAGGKRKVYANFVIPENILGPKKPGEKEKCFPEEGVDVNSNVGIPPPMTLKTKCKNPGKDPSPGLICVIEPEAPELEANLSATPSPPGPVYQSSIISYILKVRNLTKKKVSSLSIVGTIPEQTTCRSGNCSGISVGNPQELDPLFPGEFEYRFRVQVNRNAFGDSIFHPGLTVSYTDEQERNFSLDSNSLRHDLIAKKEPVGEFQHHLNLSRSLLLNAKERNAPRADLGDRTIANHSFSYEGTGKDNVWPKKSGTGAHFENLCGPYAAIPIEKQWLDDSNGSMTTIYNGPNTTNSIQTFANLEPSAGSFAISLKLPESRPELVVEGSSSAHELSFSYPMNAADLQAFISKGGNISKENLAQQSLRAVGDGVLGKVSATNTINLREDLWEYKVVSSYRKVCVVSKPGESGAKFQDIFVPIYAWVGTPQRNFMLEASDTENISVLSSVAWVQTKFGNLGIGKFPWTEDGLPSGSPNEVDLGDSIVASLMKWYTPPEESHADLFTFSQKGENILNSGLGANGKRSLEEKPVNDEVYTRKNNPRNFFDDLVNREIYGKVVRLNSDDLPPGMNKLGDVFTVNGMLTLEPDTVYYAKGTLKIGSSAKNDVIISGGKARLVIEGNAYLTSNIRYSSNTGSDLSTIPSLRLHATGNIVIAPEVTDVELMMLAEQEFHSGRSASQLRILGDVIAKKVFWERQPLLEPRTQEEQVNKPSELIYEDFRKYILSPPGDKKLPDYGNWWEEE